MHRHSVPSWRFLCVEHRWRQVRIYFLCHECGETFSVRPREH